MTHTTWHIPDPDTQPEFYSDVPLKRLIAWGIDSVIILVLTLIVLPFTAFTGLFFFPVLFLLVGFFYRLASIVQGSATLGMRLVAIEFRTISGEKLNGGCSFWHSFGYTVSCFFLPLLLVSMVMMITTNRRQGLQDFFLGTVAVNRRAAM